MKEVLRVEADEREEENQQHRYEASSRKFSFQKAKKKPGPKNTEENETLKDRFPDGQVSFQPWSIYSNLVIFSVSGVTLQKRSGQQHQRSFVDMKNASIPEKQTFSSVNGQGASM